MICSASIAHLAGNTMPTPPIAPWGQYGSVLRLLPRGGNTAPCYAYCPWGQYGSVLRLLPVGAIRLRATPIAPWGQYGSVLRLLPRGGNTAPCYAYCPRGGNTAPRPPLAGMAVARRDANDYFLLWRSHSMALMRNVLLSSSL